MRKMSASFLILATLLLLALVGSGEASSLYRSRRAVMMRLTDQPKDCMESSIKEKNASNAIVITGTVTSCGSPRAGSYKCTIQVWRIMKGSDMIRDIMSGEDTFARTFTSNSYLDVYGFGNNKLCKSFVKDHDSKIFFMNRITNKAVLGSSVMHITLANLEDTQHVIEGREIEERPMIPHDACLDVLCGYGAQCRIVKGLPTCKCPDMMCEEGEEVEEAPVCGSDGKTYASECLLKKAQCNKQKRIKIISHDYCRAPNYSTYPTVAVKRPTQAPSTTSTDTMTNSGTHDMKDALCAEIECLHGAECQVESDERGEMTASCECPTCDDSPVAPVCGSDQRSHRSHCDMRKLACRNSVEVSVLRFGPCDPCEIYNATQAAFVRSCTGTCTLDERGRPRCCDDIICEGDAREPVCGSDGRSYESACALEKHACRTARDIKIVANRLCGQQKPSTVARGSFSIAENENCPAGCDIESAEFEKFTQNLERAINKKLRQSNNGMDKMFSFKIDHRRQNSIVFFFSVTLTTSNDSYTSDELPEERYLWAYQRLFDPNYGILVRLAEKHMLDLVHTENSAYNFFVEDVCLDKQCENGARCEVSKSDLGELVPRCTCDAIANPDRLPYTFACSEASSSSSEMKYLKFSNKEDARRTICKSKPKQFYFVNICEKQESVAKCSDECTGEGESCVISESGRSKCVCVTCNDRNLHPVCASNGQTFRSKCLLQQHNCEKKKNLKVAHTGSCENTCAGMMCPFYGECRISDAGLRKCECPTTDCEENDMVCGSDGREYETECALREHACKNELDIFVVSGGACDYPEYEEVSGSGEGSAYNECDCEFGTCRLIGDQYECMCEFDCTDMGREQLCGSDGNTYRNLCELQKMQCELDQSIRIVKEGPCPKNEPSARKTTGPECNFCYAAGTNHSEDGFAICDPETPQCECRPGVGGVTCNSCIPGYWDFRAVATKQSFGCKECKCDANGSTRDDCNQMNGSCTCKPGVRGLKCDRCIHDGSRVTDTVCNTENFDIKCDPACSAGRRCNELMECVCADASSCPSNAVEVCGSDGVTYRSECIMHVESCKRNQMISVDHRGPCEIIPSLPGQLVGIPLKTTATTHAPFDVDFPQLSGDGSGDGTECDDEDSSCESSGEESNLGPLIVEPPIVPIVGIQDRALTVMGEAKFHLDDKLYNPKLSNPKSKIHRKYSQEIKDEILKLSNDSTMENSGARAKIVRVTIKEFMPVINDEEKVKATFELQLLHRISIDQLDLLTVQSIQVLLNAAAKKTKVSSDYRIWLPGKN